MHSSATRNEFLRLRVQGLSFARIGRQLGVSKPTLIKWSRQLPPSTPDPSPRQNGVAAGQPSTVSPLSADQEIADLTRKLTALKQELFSRAMREIPTPYLETLAGELRQRIRHLESLNSPAPDDPPPRSADLRSAVSQTSSLQGSGIPTNPSIQ